MKTIKFKKKSSKGDIEHIFVTQTIDENENIGYTIDILILTKHPEIYKYDYFIRLFKGYVVIHQVTFWRESTLREIIGAIDIINNK